MPLTETIETEYRKVRDHCGYFWMEDWTLTRVTGKDTFNFLQSQTTNDCLRLKAGEGHANAIVSRKANLLGTFTLYKIEEHAAWLLTERFQLDRIVDCLEEFKFREDIHFEKSIPGISLLTLQGPKAPLLLEGLGDTHKGEIKTHEAHSFDFESKEVWVLEKSLTGEPGFILAIPDEIRGRLFEILESTGSQLGWTQVSGETRELLRIEAGLPVYGRDMDDKVLLPETGLEHSAVSYHKGCYTGQEVIARLKTYGSPSFALMGVTSDTETPPPMNGEIRLKTKRLGVVKSGAWSPELNKSIALAYIQKDFRSPGKTLKVTIDGEDWTLETALLPFHQTASNLERAENLHQQAMTLYKNETDLEKPIQLLREAIALAPKFALGYEALGVLLSKQNKLDEAIALMKRLAEIDPTEIMAHSNLSVYYMQQGRIEDAEAEKAEATALQFEAIIEENQKKKAREEQAKVAEAERERQIGMFKQVLEIDPVDQVANFGLGSIYLEQGLFSEAETPLKTVVEHFPDYSAAYLALGKTLVELKKNEEAREVFQKGIAAASRKGDLMPLRDMQSRLNQL